MQIRLSIADAKSKNPRELRGFSGGVPEGIRTPGLLIRSQTLYPAELQVQPVWNGDCGVHGKLGGEGEI
jgi:hypothetical protein